MAVKASTAQDSLKIHIPKNEIDKDRYGLSIKKSFPKLKFSRVTPILRNKEKSKDYFDPKVISIGPYHHGKDHLQQAEELKTVVMAEFISQTYGISKAEYYNKVFEVKDEARSCYVQGSTDYYDDSAFTEMMLRDGCFILHFMGNFAEDNNHLILGNLGLLGVLTIIVDMFLLENQLPFQVLQVLLSFRYEKYEGEQFVKAFMSSITHLRTNESWTTTEDGVHRTPCHLLDLLHKYILPSEYTKHHQSLGSLQNVLYYQKICKVRKEERQNNDIQSFRSVTELKAKGIYVKPGTSFYSTDIKFKSYWYYGILRLSLIDVNAHTIIFCMNLIAYELGPGVPDSDFGFSTYFTFLSSLVDSREDVKELRAEKIIHNHLGSDEEVAKMFKEVATYSLQYFGIYEDIRERIQEHYNSKMKTWMADLTHKYFSSPWNFIAFLAAIYVVLLSSAQAYFTTWPRSLK